MADLLAPDTDVPSPRRRRSAHRPEGPPTPRPEPIPLEVPLEIPMDLWAPAPDDGTSYPSRMARRRALEQAQIRDEWQPSAGADDVRRVEQGLRAVEHAVADVPAGSVVPEGPSRTSSRRGSRVPRHRRRALVALVALVTVVLVLAAGGFAALRWDASRAPHAPAAAPVVPAAPSSLLVLADGGRVTGTALLVGDGAGHATVQEVLLPSRLLLDVAGAGRVPLSAALATGVDSVSGAVGGALGVRVDDAVVLDRAGLSALVDAVGGVVVDVDSDLTSVDSAGTTTVLIPAGAGQRLTGAQAVTYAGKLADAEPEATRLARQERLVDALLPALPDTASAVAGLLRGLPQAPADADALAAHLVQVRAAAAREGVASTVVPTTDIETGGAVTYYSLDSKAAAALVTSRLTGARLPVPAGGALSVMVRNGVGTPGLGQVARDELVDAGHRFSGGGNVEGFGQTESVVLIESADAPDRAKGVEVAHVLGLPDSALSVGDAPPPGVDVVVVLGADFHAKG